MASPRLEQSPAEDEAVKVSEIRKALIAVVMATRAVSPHPMTFRLDILITMLPLGNLS